MERTAMSPLGIVIKPGQKWREVDPRTRGLTVTVEYVCQGMEYVRIKRIRSTQAAVRRFNGKRGGYEFVSER